MHRLLPIFEWSFRRRPLDPASAEAQPTAHLAANNTSAARLSDKRVRATSALTASRVSHGLPKLYIRCGDDGRSSASRRFLPTHLAAKVGHPATPPQCRPKIRLSNAVRSLPETDFWRNPAAKLSGSVDLAAASPRLVGTTRPSSPSKTKNRADARSQSSACLTCGTINFPPRLLPTNDSSSDKVRPVSPALASSESNMVADGKIAAF